MVELKFEMEVAEARAMMELKKKTGMKVKVHRKVEYSESREPPVSLPRQNESNMS